MEGLLDGLLKARFTRRQVFKTGFALAGELAVNGCTSAETRKVVKFEDGKRIITFQGQNNGKTGTYERSFNPDALRGRPEIAEDIPLPGTNKTLRIQFIPMSLERKTNVSAQILVPGNNPDSYWEADLQTDFSALNDLKVSWKNLELERRAVWNGKEICFDLTNRCNSVALAIQ